MMGAATEKARLPRFSLVLGIYLRREGGWVAPLSRTVRTLAIV